jgi:hypothetical protein
MSQVDHDFMFLSVMFLSHPRGIEGPPFESCLELHEGAARTAQLENFGKACF